MPSHQQKSLLNPGHLNRRSLLGGALAGATYPVLVSAGADKIGSQVPQVFRFNVGDFEVTAVGDGYFELPVGFLPNADETEASRIQAENRVPVGPSFRGTVNTYLVNSGSRLTMIDTGARDHLFPTVGKLFENFPASGYAPEDVDRVVVTHMHPDHIGGIVDMAGGRAFPNATLHVNRDDYAFRHDPAMKAAAGVEFAMFFDVAVASAAVYSDRLEFFGFGDDLGDGLHAFDMAGHTPGHTGLRLVSGDAQLAILGDVVHAATLQFARPDWGVAADVDRDRASAARRRALDEASQDRLLVAGMHIPFPGVGHVSKMSDGFRFHPIGWMHAL